MHAFGAGNPVGGVTDVLQVVVLAIPIAGILLMLLTAGRRAAMWVWGTTKGRPVARILALAVAGVGIAALLYAWIPGATTVPSPRASEGPSRRASARCERCRPAPAVAPSTAGRSPSGGHSPVRAHDQAMARPPPTDPAPTGQVPAGRAPTGRRAVPAGDRRSPPRYQGSPSPFRPCRRRSPPSDRLGRLRARRPRPRQALVRRGRRPRRPCRRPARHSRPARHRRHRHRMAAQQRRSP